jgi:hypothetical protein
MKFTILILFAVVLVIAVLVTACKKRGPEADAAAAIGQGNYQFIALLDSDGNWTYPKVPEIPDWYFQTTGTRMRPTKKETREADADYMTRYNDALYRGLKEQGKFHVIEENIAKIKPGTDPTEK